MEETRNTQTGEMILAAMEEKGVSIRDLAKQIEGTYEHVRKIVRGGTVPSNYVLHRIAPFLDLSYEALVEIAKGDRVRLKFGDAGVKFVVSNESLKNIENNWVNLTAEQQQKLEKLSFGYAAQNKMTMVA